MSVIEDTFGWINYFAPPSCESTQPNLATQQIENPGGATASTHGLSQAQPKFLQIFEKFDQ